MSNYQYQAFNIKLLTPNCQYQTFNVKLQISNFQYQNYISLNTFPHLYSGVIQLFQFLLMRVVFEVSFLSMMFFGSFQFFYWWCFKVSAILRGVAMWHPTACKPTLNLNCESGSSSQLEDQKIHSLMFFKCVMKLFYIYPNPF